MNEKHKQGQDGLLEDGVSYYPADAHAMQTFVDAWRDLSQFSSPILVHTHNPHERLYIAAFDGTGNDALKDPEHATNIYKIDKQLEELRDSSDRQIGVGYVPGPGTQDNLIDRTWDGMRGYTYDARIEQMYKLFIEQASRWLDEDPNIQIRIADIGFSRGAEEAAGFARLVHERGIQNLDGASYTYDANGQITHVTYSKPPILAPGQFAQVVGLFDPVGTGVPVNDKDRRLPPSVISGFQLIAEDEHRGLFKSSHIIDPGITPDGRFLGVLVAGAHSDVGGSYHRDGLSIRNGNLMIDYLNALSDQPYLGKTAEPDDPRRNVVHRSEEGMLLYRAWEKVDRRAPEGYEERLVPKDQVNKVPDAYDAEPRDEALNRQFERHFVQIRQLPGEHLPARQHNTPEIGGQADPQTRHAVQNTQTHQTRAQEPSLAPDSGMRRDNSGDAVGALQQQLRNLGYTDARGRPVPVDGHFGPITHAAVQAFQQEHGLAVDGIAGPQTQTMLQRQIQQAPQHTPAPIMARQTSAPVTTPSTPTHTESQASASSARQAADEAARAAQQVRLQQQIAHQQRVAAEEKDAAQRATEERIIQQRAAEPAPIPDHLRDFRHASHPLHGTYADVLDAVHAMEDDRQIPHSPESEKLAATLTYRIATTRFEDGPAHASPLFHAVDRVDMRDRDTIVAIEPRVNYALAPKEVSVSINHALSQSVPQTSETWARQAMPHLFEPAPTHARAPAVDVARLPDYDLRHPDHPQHRAYQTLRERVAQVYARDGVPVSDDHLERATAALAVERQRLEIGEPSTLRLIHQPHTGNTGAQSLLVMSESLPNGYSLEAEVTAKAMQVPPEQSYQQLAQVTQQQSVEQQQLLQQAHGAARTL